VPAHWAFVLGQDSRKPDLKISGSIPAKVLSATSALLLICAVAQADTSKKTSTVASKSAITSSHKATRKGKRSRKASWRRGQQKIDVKRAREIQEALIREHYMQGKPTGLWDQTSQKAMERYQAQNGWQSKTVPDARALIKLGLGPDHEHLLNPESAMTTGQPPHTLPANSPAEPKDPNQ
jgi:hypothetical protein